MVRFPGVRIAPTMSTWTCSKTRSEKSGAKVAKSRIIMVGGVRIWFTSFDGSVTSVPYLFFLKMAKVQLRISEKGDNIPTLLLPLFTGVRGRGILGSPDSALCIAPVLCRAAFLRTGQGRFGARRT